MMVNTLEFANDLAIHKEERQRESRGEERRGEIFFFLPSVLIDSGTMTDA